MLQSGIESYQVAQINSAAPGKLLLLTYNALISSLLQAKKLIHEKPQCFNGNPTWIERSHNHLSKAMVILTELIKALNFKQGEDIAKNLYVMYIHIYDLIIEADFNKETEFIDRALNLVIPLRDSFEEADKTWRKEVRRQKVG